MYSPKYISDTMFQKYKVSIQDTLIVPNIVSQIQITASQLKSFDKNHLQDGPIEPEVKLVQESIVGEAKAAPLWEK